jgi:PAS domain S-box-containing protein
MPSSRETVSMPDRRQESGRRAKQLRARLHRGLSQLEFANLAGVGRSTVQKIENGEKGVGVGMLALVAKALFVPVDEINPECYVNWRYLTDEDLIKCAELQKNGAKSTDTLRDNSGQVAPPTSDGQAHRYPSISVRPSPDASLNARPVVAALTDRASQPKTDDHRAARDETAAFRHTDHQLDLCMTMLRLQYEHLPMMVHSIDETGVICNVNTKWLTVLGYQREEVIGKSADFLMTPESAELAMLVIIPEFWARGYCRDVPYQYKTKDGRVIDVLLNCVATSDVMGKSISMSFVQEATSNVRLRERLEDSKVEHQQRLGDELAGFYETDLWGNFVSVNERMIQVLGFSGKDALLGKNFREVMDKQSAKYLYTLHHSAFVEHTAKVGNIWEIRSQAGNSLAIQASISLVTASNGRILGFRGVLRQVTEARPDQLENRSRAARVSVLLKPGAAQWGAGVIQESPSPSGGRRGEGRDRPRLSLGRIPVPPDPASMLVEREQYLRLLDEAWQSDTHIVQMWADGGVGKSTIVWQWMERLKAKGYPGINQALDWYFFSQGQHDHATDSQKFLDEAVRHFGSDRLALDGMHRTAADQVGRAVAEIFCQVGGLMVLDGVEPLQFGPFDFDGRVRDAGLDGLLQHLRTAQPPSQTGQNRLLIITSRWQIPELKGAGIQTRKVEMLSEEEGADLLQRFRSGEEPLGKGLFFAPPCGHADVEREREEFKAVAREYGGHVLALRLLASYLLQLCDGNVGERRHIPPVPDLGQDSPDRHARRVMRSYDRLFTQDTSNPVSKACRQVLCMGGLFDRPANRKLLKVVRGDEPIPGLTDELTDQLFELAVVKLRALGLLSGVRAHDQTLVESHPLIRSHFAQVLRDENPSAWCKAHMRLYDYLRAQPEDPKPNTVAEMEPLFQGIVHACKAGHHGQALHEVYQPRIMRGDEFYAAHQLGAFGPLLSVLLNFFESGDRERPVRGLSRPDQLYVLIQAALFLAMTKGFAAPEVERRYKLARDLVHQDGKIAEFFSVLRGLWRYHQVAAAFSQAHVLAEELGKLAEKERDPTLLLEANFALGGTLFYLGNFTLACHHLEKEIKFPGTEHQRFLGVLSGFDPRVACDSYAGWVKWYLGCPDQARAKSKAAIAAARRLKHLPTLAYALYFAARTEQLCGDAGATRHLAEETIEMSRSNNYRHWFAGATVLLGSAIVMEGKEVKKGIEHIRGGVRDWRATGAEMGRSGFLGLLAAAYLKVEDVSQGLATIEEALSLAGRNENYYLSELHRIKGELLLLKSDPQAEYWFHQAIETARKQNGPCLELRAAMSLGRRWRGQDKRGEARRLVAEVYGRFNEGFDTTDLKDAKELLDMLA